jgi:hypothetical protein
MERPTSLAWLIAVSLCASLVSSPSKAQEQSESFDKAIRETVVDLGASPYYPGPHPRHGQLRCHYFQSFIVKELDLGQEGDEWISITPTEARRLTPCSQQHAEGEEVIHGEDWVAGYFVGVKTNFVFLEAPDCSNRGCPFGVFDAPTGKKLFEDQRRLSPKGRFAEIRFARIGGNLVMRYPRVVTAECSLPQKKSECWKEILHTTALTQQPMPECIGYSGFNQREGYGTDDESDPSVVSFPVEVTIPAFKSRILAGPVACWAAA